MINIHRVLLAAMVILVCAGSVWASSSGDPSPWDNPWNHVGRVFNTVCLIGVLIYYLKKPLLNFFSERRTQIAKDLDAARIAREEAEKSIAEYQAKIAGLEQELEKMRAELKRSSDVETAKVKAGAERMAAAMVEAARMTADQEVRKAKLALKNEAAQLAVELAEALIRERINEEDRARLVDEYFVKVGGMK